MSYCVVRITEKLERLCCAVLSDSLESWVALISSAYAELVIRRCLQQPEGDMTSSLLGMITHFMAKGL